MIWRIVYEKALRHNGELYFPAKLSREFLEQAKRTMGSYLFANQYLNEVIPLDAQSFKKDWFQYTHHVPSRVNTFIFIDPAISQADSADYTGIVVVSIDYEGTWFVRLARRYKVTPTQLIALTFELDKEFSPQVIGIEEVAYQKALLYFLDEEMRRRNLLLPIKGIRAPNTKSKQMRILSLVPRFEWGHIYFRPGFTDLELELLSFPRGSHDDLIDALSYIEFISYKPDKEKEFEKPPASNHPSYEKWFIQQRIKGSNNETESEY